MDYYAELGIKNDASETEIKLAYRRLAKIYHPDRNKTLEAEEKIKKVNEAYGVLSDKIKKNEYDNKKSKTFVGFGKSNFDISDIFTKSFEFDKNIKQKNNKNCKNFESQDKLTITISFIDSIMGVVDKSVDHTFKHECISCEGYGGMFAVCSNCGGNGKIHRNDGFISINITCNQCNGQGKKISSVCNVCDGHGFLEKKEELFITIPEGLESKTKLLIKGKGNNLNGSRGDLYVTVEINDDAVYSRIGNDILVHLKVSVIDILSENTIDVITFRGNQSIKLHPKTTTTDIVEKGKGTKSINSNVYGDMIIKLVPIIPVLTDEEKNIIKKINKKL